MPPIDSLGAYAGASAAQYQPRQTPPSSQNGGEDNRGQTIQQYLQSAQQGGQDQGVETQTTGAVVQATNAQQSQQGNRAANNDNGSTIQTLSQTLNRLSNVGSARPEPANQPETTQPETSPTSALNYTASGAASPTQSPTDAGRRVSLSV